MKYIKMLGLLVVAAAALMAFAGTASATTLTGPNGEETPTIHAVSEGHVKLQTFVNIECPSTAEGTVTTHGPSETVEGNFTVLTFGHTGNPCTNSWHVTVVNPGKLVLHYKAHGEGTVTSTGATVTTTRLGVTCNYVTNETDIGVLTDRDATDVTTTNTLHVNAEIDIHSGSSGLCGSGKAKWTGSYALTAPVTLHQ